MTAITRGSGNVFADIGVPDPETHLVKAELVRRIGKLIESDGLGIAEAAARMGLAEAEVTKMLKGQFRSLTIERLMRCLTSLGQTVVIDVRPTGAKSSPEIRVTG